MKEQYAQEATIPNPALEPFDVLTGEWDTTGTHPYMPGIVLHGRTFFKWIEGGAFLMMYSEIDEPGIPSGISVFGSDDVTGEYFMLYFDERKVSRKYNVSFNGNVLKWWRTTPEFSQTFTCTFQNNNNTIIGKGELSKNGAPWEKDLELIYQRS